MKKWFLYYVCSLVVLQIVFGVLGWTNVINWPWWCIFLPACIAIASIIIYVVVYLAMTGATFLKKIIKR